MSTAGRALALVGNGKRVALATGVEDAEGEAAHQRGLLGAVGARANRVQQLADLARDAGRARARALHQLAHPRLADAHARRGVRAREALQVAQRGRLALARAQPAAQALHQLTQPRTVVQLARAVTLGGYAGLAGRVACVTRGVCPRCPQTRTVLVDRAAISHERQPALRVGDLRRLAVEHRRIQPVPCLGVTRLQIPQVEADARRAQSSPHGREDPPPHRLELPAQQPFGSVATHGQWAHSQTDYELIELFDYVTTVLEASSRSALQINEIVDLGEPDRAHVISAAVRLVPGGDSRERLVEIPAGPPAEPAFGRRGVELQPGRLRRVG